MKTVKKILATVAVLLAAATPTEAQETVKGNVSCDLVSHYMWRGSDRGGISIMPEAKVSWQGASLKLQGVTGFDKDDAKEIDLNLGYEYRFSDYCKVNVGVTDYWTSGMDKEGHSLYFEWDPAENGHQLEVNLGVDFTYFKVNAYTMVWGNDFQYNTLSDMAQRVNGKRAYSTFIEVGVPFYFGGIDWDLSAGMTPFEGAYDVEPYDEISTITVLKKKSFYADKAAFIMASLRATKRLEFGDVRVPIFAELHANPYLKSANFLVGVSIEPFK